MKQNTKDIIKSVIMVTVTTVAIMVGLNQLGMVTNPKWTLSRTPVVHAAAVNHHLGKLNHNANNDSTSLARYPRFNHKTITVGVNPQAPQSMKDATDAAIAAWNQAGVLHFEMAPYNYNDDVLIDNVHIAGNAGGQSGQQGLNKSGFYTVGKTWLNPDQRTANGVIKHAKIEIDPQNIKTCSPTKDDQDTMTVNTIEHELGHAVGLPHIKITNEDQSSQNSVMLSHNNGPVNQFDYGLLDRLYTNQDLNYSNLYHLPMTSGYVIDNHNIN